MTTAPFDAESRSHLAAQAKDAGPWDPAWPLARQRQVWEDQCKRVRARRPDRLMVEDLDVGFDPRAHLSPAGRAPQARRALCSWRRLDHGLLRNP